MCPLRILCVLVMTASSLLAQTAAHHSVQLGDLDRAADPCTDFPEYSSGGWHKQNAIPAYMDRWSRRWQSGENAKDQLKEILDDVSKKADWPKGSVEQLIGDYYGSCMDESRINKLGLAPSEPMLKEIDGMKNAADLQRMIRRFHEFAITVPFRMVARPDNHNPTQTIAFIYASGLGLPDRDYYLKPEQRFQEAREKYLVHVANMFKLAGYDDAKANTAAKTVFELKKMAPAMDWDGYFAAARISHADLNVSEPKFMQEADRQLRETSLADWKTYMKWQLLNGAADTLSEAFVKENFEFNGKYLSGATEIKPRWKRCAESTDQLLGEALGQKYVQKYFPPEAKKRAQEMVSNILAAMHDTIEGLEWMSPETKKKALEKLSTFNPKIGYPDKWKDYSSIKLARESYWNNSIAVIRWNEDDDRSQIGKPVDRWRWGMTPPTSNAYYNPLLNE